MGSCFSMSYMSYSHLCLHCNTDKCTHVNVNESFALLLSRGRKQSRLLCEDTLESSKLDGIIKSSENVLFHECLSKERMLLNSVVSCFLLIPLVFTFAEVGDLIQGEGFIFLLHSLWSHTE